MTVALPVTADPAALAEPPRVSGLWRSLPAKAKAGTVLLGVFVLAGIIGPLVTPYDPSFQNPSPALSLQPPSASHLLGTTQSGQDVLSQLLVGIRLTLELAAIVGIVATALSVIVGVSAAFLGGFWDDLLSLLSNVFLVIPALPLLILLLGYLPQRGQEATILVLSGLGWPWGARPMIWHDAGRLAWQVGTPLAAVRVVTWLAALFGSERLSRRAMQLLRGRTGTGPDSGDRLGVGDVSVVVHVGHLDPVRVQIEHREAEAGPVLAILPHRPRAVPRDAWPGARWRVGVGQDGHAAVAQAPRVADAACGLVGDGPVLVAPPPCRDAVPAQDPGQLGRQDPAGVRAVVHGHQLVMAEQHELAR